MAAASDLRANAISTHPYLGYYLDGNVINHLVFLFGEQYRDYKLYPNQPPKRIETYIEKEHLIMGIPLIDLSYNGMAYGYEKSVTSTADRFDASPTFLVEVLYEGKILLHLTIHLALEVLPKDKAGMIHFDRDIYKKNGQYPIKGLDTHVVIRVNRMNQNGNSLQFSILDDYDTPTDASLQHINNMILQEMNIIIRVLNKMFNPTNRDYSVQEIIFPMNPITDIITNQMNTLGIVAPRRNKGKRYVPEAWRDQNVPTVNIGKYTKSNRTKKNTRSMRRVRKSTLRHRTASINNGADFSSMNKVNNASIVSTTVALPNAIPHEYFEMSPNLRNAEMFIPFVPYVKPPPRMKKPPVPQVKKPKKTREEWNKNYPKMK